MRNIVLVTIDSLRADHCGFMGYERNTTPTLDTMAADGLVFENAIAPGPRTPESMPAIFTGKYPSTLNAGLPSLLSSHGDMTRDHMQARQTIADRFSKRGFTTGGFTPNPYTSRYFGFNKGFDYFEDFITGDVIPRNLPAPLRVVNQYINKERKFKPWESYIDSITSWVKSVDEPYFLWIMPMDVHTPYLTPSDYRTYNKWWETLYANWWYWRQNHNNENIEIRQRLINAYDDTIRYVDEFLTSLADSLSESDPVFVICADHGEAFGEHGTYGHQQQLYNENLHVPFVIANSSKTGSIRETISLRKLGYIIRNILLNEAPMSSVVEEESENIVIAKTSRGPTVAVMTNSVKYISNPSCKPEFYKTRSDSREENDISEQITDSVNLFEELCRCHIQSESEQRLLQMAVKSFNTVNL